jgi:hypothetical protein
MWNLVIRDTNGTYHRESFHDKPNQTDVTYWEDYYKILKVDPKAPYYDNTYSECAVVVNVFYLEDD